MFFHSVEKLLRRRLRKLVADLENADSFGCGFNVHVAILALKSLHEKILQRTHRADKKGGKIQSERLVSLV